jgi:mannose-6-phosphate isomerase-like protein (cupin superfamily)
MSFTELCHETLRLNGSLGATNLVVEPRKKLSWQHYHSRAEIWRPLPGNAGALGSASDRTGPWITLKEDKSILTEQGQRHRLFGL